MLDTLLYTAMLTAVLTAHVDADLVATDQGCFTRIILISVDGREHVINILVSCSMLSRCTLKGKKARPHMNHNDMMHCGRVLIACFGTLPAEGWCGVVWCGVVWWCGVMKCAVVWCGVVWYVYDIGPSTSILGWNLVGTAWMFRRHSCSFQL